jgi:hypothetical protein
VEGLKREDGKLSIYFERVGRNPPDKCGVNRLHGDNAKILPSYTKQQKYNLWQSFHLRPRLRRLMAVFSNSEIMYFMFSC